MNRYFHNEKLFGRDYFNRVLEDSKFPTSRKLPVDWKRKLVELQQLWETDRLKHMEYNGDIQKKVPGLPVGWKALSGNSESNIESGYIRKVLEKTFGYAVDNNRTLKLQGEAAKEVKNRNSNQRPDMVLFSSDQALTSAAKDLDKKDNNAVTFCKEALFILDAKVFSKGVGADEEHAKFSKKEQGAYEDIQQVDRYLRGCDKKWGILTNGRCWRLMRSGDGETLVHLRFDLVLFLEDLRNPEIDLAIDDPKTERIFNLFWHLFGMPAVSGGFLDLLDTESQANTRKVREILKNSAHRSVELTAQGFFHHPGNGYTNSMSQGEMDHLRELSLTLLYRLLFILKAEALDLLPLRDENGAETTYAREFSTRALFESLKIKVSSDRANSSRVYKQLKDLFQAISKGGEAGIPAYNGDLFNADRNSELEEKLLYDEYLYQILESLIYLEGNSNEPVPYEDLEVRDLGAIYEGLLEQRLLLEFDPKTTLRIPVLRNQKGERKSSGSYFTPDRLVDHLVRKTVTPLLEGCGSNVEQILNLRIVDPAMGSGHFLVKAVDIMASWLTVNCEPLDEGAPADNGPKEFRYWKNKVVEHCIYGVDYNPMAVELAKVSLWLHTARKDRPLSFLDHHLKCGNSLIGARLEDLAAPGLKSKNTKEGAVWVPAGVNLDSTGETLANKKKRKKKFTGQLSLPFVIDTSLFGGILESIHRILNAPSESADDVRKKSQNYAKLVGEKLVAQKALADLWCAQWFKTNASETGIMDYESPTGIYDRLKAVCGQPDDTARFGQYQELFKSSELLQVIEAERNKGYGPRQFAYFHWQLEFPEVAFDNMGELKKGFGFDAVVGNPPWDKIKPAKKDFYGQFSEDIAGSQSGSMDRLIMTLEEAQPHLGQEWCDYEKNLKDFAAYLSTKGEFQWQTVKVNGKKTGGDPDLFRYFVERAFQCAKPDARIGYLVPAVLWQAEGCTGLRRMLLQDSTLESLEVFENYRKWAFSIHSSFKFTSFVTTKKAPRKNATFTGAFMLRDTRYLDGLLPERQVKLSVAAIEKLSPDTLALLDIKSDGDFQLISRLHDDFPALGSQESGWKVKYRSELHMTNDSWLFKKSDWMKARGFTEVYPVADGEGWHQAYDEEQKPCAAKLPDPLPRIGNYWVAADAGYYRDSGYKELTFEVDSVLSTAFISHEDLEVVGSSDSRFEEKHFRIIPHGIYTPLYEGRLVHNYDHCQKKYIEGDGRTAQWDDFAEGELKRLQAHYFVCKAEVSGLAAQHKLGYTAITGATNERSCLASIIPSTSLAGNSVPVLTADLSQLIPLQAMLSSFVFDAILRLRVSTNLSWSFLQSIVLPAFADANIETLKGTLLKLSCTTPEMAQYWEDGMGTPWSYSVSPRDPWERGALRADLDAFVAGLYNLSVEDYARVLTSFPLLDRNFEALEGDYFLTETDDNIKSDIRKQEGVDWIENSAGVFELKPRSFITRDFALFTYMKKKEYPIPSDLEQWFKTKVKLDPNGTLSRFRIGKEKNLLDRIARAKSLKAIPYIPSSR